MICCCGNESLPEGRRAECGIEGNTKDMVIDYNAGRRAFVFADGVHLYCE